MGSIQTSEDGEGLLMSFSDQVLAAVAAERVCDDRILNHFLLEERNLSEKIAKQSFVGNGEEMDWMRSVGRYIPESSTLRESPNPSVLLPDRSPVRDEHEFQRNIHTSEDFQLVDLDECSLSDPCSEPVKFSSRGQARSGSHHGRGGRKKGSGYQVRRNYGNYARSVISRRMLHLYSMNNDHCFEFLIETLLENRVLNGSVEEVMNKFKVRFMDTLKDSIGAIPYTIQELPFCVLGMSARFAKSDSVWTDAQVMESSMSRHITNTWIDESGGLRCTCLGSTQYSILAHNNEFDVPCCDHTQAFADIFKNLSTEIFGESCLSPSIIHKTLSSAVPDLLDPLENCLPVFRYIHRNRTVVYICTDVKKDSEYCWVPIRCVQRKGVKHLCAFCDSISTNSCHHVKGFLSLQMDPQSVNSHEFEDEILTFETQTQTETVNGYLSSMSGPISFLPVSPVNCAMAIRTEFLVCQKVRNGETFTLLAPSCCVYCGGMPVAGSEKTNTSGVIMCMIGACKMEVRTLNCSECLRTYSAEGRSEGVFLESICSAATHALLRNELLGFAQGNGTLNSRLNQLHSYLTSIEDSNMFPNALPTLSAKTLFGMSTKFAKLTLIDPPKDLFRCSTCQTTSNGNTSVPNLVCIDGIWAGYLRKSKRAFENVTFSLNEPGKINDGARLLARPVIRPRTSLVRLEKTVTFLLLALKGEKIEITSTTVNAAISAVRLVNDLVLPKDFYRSAVCGRSASDFDFDDGECLLRNIQRLTRSIFDERTLLYRILKPILDYFQGSGKRRKPKARSQLPVSVSNLLHDSEDGESKGKKTAGKKRKKILDPRICCDIISQALQISPLGREDTDSFPWNPLISNLMKKDDSGIKIVNLYRALIQGPVTHFLPKFYLGSTRVLAMRSIEDDPKVFMKDMVTKETYNVMDKGTGITSNVTEVNRIVLSGLFSAAVVDGSEGLNSTTRLLPLFGNLLLDTIWLIERFYEFYDTGLSETNGATISSQYAREWSTKDYNILRKRFKDLAASEKFQPGAYIDYDDAYTTGTFFPSFPQIRPLLFDDQGRKAHDQNQYGFCSKHYWQQKGSFTPGAVTFCCGCAHPIVFGFKVLEWDEGPRAILDVLVSRFPSFPRYLIYDFACGVYKSAAHSLSWAMENSTLVSDPFHGSNHVCSPAFTKTAHIPLDRANTISHEQRNRPIAKIKNSLQQTSQQTYITLLAFQIMVNNISAKTRTTEHTKQPVQNRCSTDLEWGFFKRLNMVCRCCPCVSEINSDLCLEQSGGGAFIALKTQTKDNNLETINESD